MATKAQMIERRTRKGFNRAESAELLEQLIAAHDGDNLAHALHYEDFATAKQAEAFAGTTR